jgi:hypothetical protein
MDIKDLIEKEFEQIWKNNPNVYDVYKKKDLPDVKYIFIF